jgi:hypothetical protein
MAAKATKMGFRWQVGTARRSDSGRIAGLGVAL